MDIPRPLTVISCTLNVPTGHILTCSWSQFVQL